MSGHEVLRELRKQSSTPVLMFTGLGSEAERIQGLDFGADDYLPKTFSSPELLARLRALVRRSFLNNEEIKDRNEQRRELEQARDIQMGLLPRAIPEVSGLDIGSVWKPAKSVSGDYYDVIPAPGGKTVICIGDVSGKGMPAALLMANVQAAIKAFAPQNLPPAELCRRVNLILWSNSTGGRFMSLFFGLFDPQEQQVAYTCAGHNPPILLRSDGSETRLVVGGTVLGLFPDSEYETEIRPFKPGDRLVLFTDGVTECINAAEEEFGEERLRQTVRANSGANATSLAGSVIDAVCKHAGDTFQDDATLVVVHALPA